MNYSGVRRQCSSSILFGPRGYRNVNNAVTQPSVYCAGAHAFQCAPLVKSNGRPKPGDGHARDPKRHRSDHGWHSVKKIADVPNTIHQHFAQQDLVEPPSARSQKAQGLRRQHFSAGRQVSLANPQSFATLGPCTARRLRPARATTASVATRAGPVQQVLPRPTKHRQRNVGARRRPWKSD